MKRWWIVFLLTILLAGCEQAGTNEAVRSGGERKPAASPAVALPDETGSAQSAEVEQLKEEIRRLKRELERHEMEKHGMEPERHPEVYRRIDRFRSADAWDEVAVYNGETRVTMAEPAFFEALRPRLNIGEPISWGGTTPYTLEAFSIELKAGDETVVLHAVSKGAVEFPDILPGIHFRTDLELTNLGKALLPKPDFLPAESVGSRMLDSGFLLVRQDGYQSYVLSESRIRVMAVAFLRAEKKEAAKPDLKEEERLVEVSFFHYGDQIVMDVYPEWIRIQDGQTEIWYEVNPFDTEQMDMALRAD